MIKLIFLIIGSLFMVSCTTTAPMPRKYDDIAVDLILSKDVVTQHTKYDMEILDDLTHPVNPAGYLLMPITIPIAALGEATVNLFQGCDVFVCPVGSGKEYNQQIYWGSNKVYLPRKFLMEGGKLYFLIKGSRCGYFFAEYSSKTINSILLSGDNFIETTDFNDILEEINSELYDSELPNQDNEISDDEWLEDL